MYACKFAIIKSKLHRLKDIKPKLILHTVLYHMDATHRLSCQTKGFSKHKYMYAFFGDDSHISTLSPYEFMYLLRLLLPRDMLYICVLLTCQTGRYGMHTKHIEHFLFNTENDILNLSYVQNCLCYINNLSCLQRCLKKEVILFKCSGNES